MFELLLRIHSVSRSGYDPQHLLIRSALDSGFKMQIPGLHPRPTKWRREVPQLILVYPEAPD